MHTKRVPYARVIASLDAERKASGPTLIPVRLGVTLALVSMQLSATYVVGFTRRMARRELDLHRTCLHAAETGARR